MSSGGTAYPWACQSLNSLNMARLARADHGVSGVTALLASSSVLGSAVVSCLLQDCVVMNCSTCSAQMFLAKVSLGPWPPEIEAS